ncbi:MAG TPA: acetyl-CoA C-acyltransferase [Kofleriaceae bacterium]|jgi:acetyl-CoA C-acetyltransferase
MTALRDVFVLTGARTPRGKGSAKGALHAIPPVKLVTHVLGALRPRLGAARVDDVIVGCATQSDEQGANLARSATLLAGWDAHVPGLTVNRFCASGLEAIALGAARIRSADASLVVAGGVESVSRVPTFSDRGPLYHDPEVMTAAGTIHMGVAADLVATLENITREQADGYAYATREKARLASPSSFMIPTGALDLDENVAYQPTLEELHALPPSFGELDQDPIALRHYPQLSQLHHIHTRGNSPSLADAAALVAIGDRAASETTGLAPRARIIATGSCASDPVTMLTAGQLAIELVLAKAGLRAADIDVFQFAEAFGALCVKLMRDLDIGHDRLNPTGGTIARGHAYGATGAILVLEAVEELERRNGRYAIAAVSGAAGLGAAVLVERYSTGAGGGT